ncbi:indolethylamine N-methyltransferase-like [Eleutherodactylus coqui]|uniref:indolethylamine N-methyltransferase-like n=1 Tax=Eleutherodactylus coqui TaxID=57060 RepID=UPI003461F8A5
MRFKLFILTHISVTADTYIHKESQIAKMACSTHKHYHDDEFDPKLFLETYFTCENIPENMSFPMGILHELFCSGKVKGDTLLDVSLAAVIYQLISASNQFKKIYKVEFTDPNITHFKEWLEKKEGATDWSFALQKACEFEGNRDKWQEKEEQLRKTIAGVIKWDNFENIFVNPQLLPEVDCVLCLWQLTVVSKTKEEFQRNLKKFTCCLKPGGQLILFSAVNMTYYVVGKHKFFILSVDRDFIRQTVIKTGFAIEKEHYVSRNINTDLIDYEGMLCIMARKQCECPI